MMNELLRQWLAQALTVLPSLTDNYEMIVVNDGSTDATGVVVEGMALAPPHVRVIPHKKNQGLWRGASRRIQPC